ncbi:MAG: formimidoylglutamate deiminase, partial [Hyphomicrobiales bacterium]|nr:formimidoylglutamate deiminase [Hyphomicrobiales bacterium]
MEIIWAKKALTANGWQSDTRITINDDGHIGLVEANCLPEGKKVGILLASPVNLHSHAFQRAMAGMSEQRGPVGSNGHDNFWTWRNLMFRFVDQLAPEDIVAIAAFLQMEMLESGFAAVCEFHYLHHQPGGEPYGNIGQMADAIIEAAARSGIGLTLLPVLYQQGGCDGRALTTGQSRFGNSPERFADLYAAAKKSISTLGNDALTGVAPHSLRAVSQDGLDVAIGLDPGQPIHIHIAEQTGEVEELKSCWGKRPVEWLLDNHDVDQRWCLVHSTHMTDQETIELARTGAVAGLCPITESSLGDGIFNGEQYVSHAGRFGIGSDSNIHISLSQELRTFEYSQRLRDRTRAVLATPQISTGRRLFDGALIGGSLAAGRNSGSIETGKLADLIALDDEAADLYLKENDMIL